MTTKWSVVFDGSDNPGCVKLSDGVIESVAHFASDRDAKVFFGMLNEMRDEAQTATWRVQRAIEKLDLARREIQR